MNSDALEITWCDLLRGPRNAVVTNFSAASHYLFFFLGGGGGFRYLESNYEALCAVLKLVFPKSRHRLPLAS